MAAQVTKPSEPQGPKEIVLFSQLVKEHLVLVRSLPDGRCKAFLSQSEQGFLDYPGVVTADDFSATSSPNGKLIAFYSSRSGSINLWISHADGRNAEALTNDLQGIAWFAPDLDGQIAFSPLTTAGKSLDSKVLAYISHGNLWSIDLDSRNVRALTVEGGVSTFAWSPDGLWLSYVKENSIRRVSVSGASDELVIADTVKWPTLSYLPDLKNHALMAFGAGALKINSDKNSSILYSSSQKPNRVQVAPGKGENFIVLGQTPDKRPELFQVSMTKPGKGGNESIQITQGGAERGFYSLNAKMIYFVRKGLLWRCDVEGKGVSQISSQRMWTPSVGVLDLSAPRTCE